MKFLILFLITFNAFASTKVEITNYEGQKLEKTFDDDTKRDAYIQRLKHKWGKDRRWAKSECLEYTDTRVVEDMGENITEYDCPQTYSLNIVPVVVDTQAIALSKIKSDMEFGKNLYAKIRLIMSSKGLTKKQRKDTRGALGSIRDDLFDGDLCSARGDIESITAGAIISQANIDHVISLIDNHKVCE